MKEFEEQDFIKIKLPKASYFSSLNKEKDPYDKMYSYAARKAFQSSLYNILFDKKIHVLETLSKEYGMSVSDFWLCKEDEKKLEEQVIQWIMKAHKKTKGWAKKALPMHNLSRGPAVFDAVGSRPSWVVPGYVYVRKPNEQKV